MIAFWSIHWERSDAVHWPLQENKAVGTSRALVVFVRCCRGWAEAQEIYRQLWLLPAISCKLLGMCHPAAQLSSGKKGHCYFSIFLCFLCFGMPLFMFNRCLNNPTNFWWNCGSNVVLLSVWVVGQHFKAEQIHAVCLKNTWSWRSQCPDLGKGLNTSAVEILHDLARSILCFSLHIIFNFFSPRIPTLLRFKVRKMLAESTFS